MPAQPPNPDDLEALAAELAAIPNLDDPHPTGAWWRAPGGAPPPTPAAPSPRPAPTPQRPPVQAQRGNAPTQIQRGPGYQPQQARTAAMVPVAAQQQRRPAPVQQPAQAPGGPVRRRRRWGRWVLGVIGVLVLLALAVGTLGWTRFKSIERLPVAGLAAGGGGFTNYLIVGSDSREGIDPNNPNAAAILGDGDVSGQRTDTLMVLQVRGNESRLLSVPRDLMLPIAGTDYEDRVNSAYGVGGTDGLVQTISSGLGIPIHHYAEVDLAGFLGVVEATGGVTIAFDAPARDEGSGLYVEQTGNVRLDENQALAFVRSRKYERLVDGEWQPDVLGDLDRVVRQQTFLRAVASEMTSTRNPLALNRMAGAVGDAVKVDEGLSTSDGLRLAMQLRGFNPAKASLPVYNDVTEDGAQVLRLDEGAEDVLAPFRN